MLISYAPVDLDRRLVLFNDGFLQMVANAALPRAFDQLPDAVAPRRSYGPFVTKVQLRTGQRRVVRQPVVAAERLPDRHSHLAPDAGQIAEPGDDARPRHIERLQVIGRLSRPCAAPFGIPPRLFPRDPR